VRSLIRGLFQLSELLVLTGLVRSSTISTRRLENNPKSAYIPSVRAKEPKREFKIGDKIRVNLHHGKIEDAVVRAAIQDDDGIKLQVDVVGLYLTALIDTR